MRITARGSSTGTMKSNEAVVCAACGYTEFYTKDPSAIIVDGMNVRELVATGVAAR